MVNKICMPMWTSNQYVHDYYDSDDDDDDNNNITLLHILAGAQ